MYYFILKKKDKLVPIDVIKAYRRSAVIAPLILNPFQSNFFCQPHNPQLLFVLGGKKVGGLLVIILQF
jgi:hypothetical protein